MFIHQTVRRNRSEFKINNKMKRIIGILCGLFFFLFSFAQETFQKETYISSRGDTLLYRLLRPEVMKPDEKYPLVLFLHGAGERGNDNEKQLVHGGQMGGMERRFEYSRNKI